LNWHRKNQSDFKAPYSAYSRFCNKFSVNRSQNLIPNLITA